MQEISFTTPRLTLAACVWNQTEDSFILALHGWLDNAASFAALAPFLKKERLIALDFAGHGYSEHKAPGEFYYFVDYIIDVIHVIETLQCRHVTLLGHSLGAGVASFVAASLPAKVDKLVLIDGLGSFGRTPEQTTEHITTAAAAMSGLASKRQPSYASLERAIDARHQSGELDYASAELLCKRGSKRIDDRYSWRTDPRLRVRSPYYFTETQVLNALKKISAPTLLIRADEGLLHKHPFFEARYSQIKNLKICDLPGKHHLHMDAPKPVASAINDFLHS